MNNKRRLGPRWRRTSDVLCDRYEYHFTISDTSNQKQWGRPAATGEESIMSLYMRRETNATSFLSTATVGYRRMVSSTTGPDLHEMVGIVVYDFH